MKLLFWLGPPTCMYLHMTNRVTIQQEDLILKTVIKWISNQKVQDLKHLLGKDADTKEGKTILREWTKLALYQGALYHSHMLTGDWTFSNSWSPRLTGSCYEWMSLRCWTPRSTANIVCCMTGSGGQAWLLRCRWSVAVSDASNKKAFMPKPPCSPSL